MIKANYKALTHLVSSKLTTCEKYPRKYLIFKKFIFFSTPTLLKLKIYFVIFFIFY